MKEYELTRSGFKSEDHFLDSSLFKHWESIEALFKANRITKVKGLHSDEMWFYTEAWSPAGNFAWGICLHNMIYEYHYD